MTRAEHYAEAERLLDEGVEVVTRISQLADERREAHNKSSHLTLVPQYTEQMDELGKKVMGIWAQAQVHATLATCDWAMQSGEL